MRLGFYYHIPAEIRGNSIWVPSYLGRFIDSLAVYTSRLVCFLHAPRQSQRHLLDYQIQSPNVSLENIGTHTSAWKRNLFPGKYVATLQHHVGDIDLILIRGPSPLLPAFAAAAHRKGVPVALLLVGNIVDGVDDLPQPRWRKELIRLLNHLNHWRQNCVAKRCLTFVNSRKLFEQYQLIPHIVETRTTTLSEKDFFERQDFRLATPIRLLYTGRFDRGKGLLEIVEAISLLKDRGHDAHLDLVGWDDSGTGVLAEMELLAERLGVGNRILNHGLKPVGPELFRHYREADIYVIASKVSEGFPRTIWEAMAHTLPVVASKVGSIPQFIGSAAELVEPGSAVAIANGIENLILDEEKRRSMVTKGLSLARENTLERRAAELVAHLQGWLKEEK